MYQNPAAIRDIVDNIAFFGSDLAEWLEYRVNSLNSRCVSPREVRLMRTRLPIHVSTGDVCVAELISIED